MPNVDLEQLLSDSELRLCWLDRQRSLVLATAARSGRPPGEAERRGDAETLSDRDALLDDEPLLSRLEQAYRHAAPTTALHRRASLLLSTALSRRLAVQSGQRRAIRQISALVDSFQGAVNRERLALDGLRLVLKRDPSRGRREQAWEAMGELARMVGPHWREAALGLAAAWAPGQGPEPVSFWDQPLNPFRLEWGDVDVPGLARLCLQQGEHLVEQHLRHAARALRIRHPAAHDLEFAGLALGQGYEAHFPLADAAGSLGRGLRACGLPVDSLPLDPLPAPKWLPVEHAGWPPVDWAVYPTPGEGAEDNIPLAARARMRPRVLAVADFRGGQQYGWVQLATATGAALSVLHGRGGFLAERRSAPRLDPGALVIAGLITEPNWLAGQTGMARSDVPRYLALGCLRSGLLYGVYVRSLAARALIAWQLMSDPNLDPSAVAMDLLQRATGTETAGQLWALDLASVVHPAYWVSFFLNEIASAQVREYLRREHGRIMGDRRTGEMLVECFWRHGALIPLADAVRAATGAALSGAGLVAELERSTSL